MVDLSTSVAGIPLPCCIYNASGPRSGTSSALHKIAASQAGAVLSKSATLVKQSGNPQPRTHHAADGKASFNSEGLPNNGIDYYIDTSTIEEVMQGVENNKPYIVSLSGKTLEDNLEMLRRIARSPSRPLIAGIELNLACPIVIGKPIIAYDFDQMDAILAAVGKVDGLPVLGVKLPPYLDFQHFAAAAAVLNKHKNLVKYVVAINTIGNALAVDIDTKAPYISSNSGFAGMSGPAVKYTALANVRKWRELLDDDMDVVGVGGVETGEDVLAMLLCGAVAVQVGTTHWKEGPACFDRLAGELSALLRCEGYQSVRNVMGQLREWTKEGAAASRAKKKAAIATPLLSSSCHSQLRFFQALSGVLALLLAAACAHIWTSAKLLPEE